MSIRRTDCVLEFIFERVVKNNLSCMGQFFSYKFLLFAHCYFIPKLKKKMLMKNIKILK